jgi:hypothetical protein
MEHIFHLEAKAFIEAIYSTPLLSQKQKQKDEDEDEGEDEDEDLDEKWLSGFVETIKGEEIDEAVDFEPGDVLGKLLAFINQVSLLLLSAPYLISLQVHASPQASAYFAAFCIEEKLTPLALVK